jgi:hypothetical protein
MSVVRQMQFSHYDIAETAPWSRRARLRDLLRLFIQWGGSPRDATRAMTTV